MIYSEEFARSQAPPLSPLRFAKYKAEKDEWQIEGAETPQQKYAAVMYWAKILNPVKLSALQAGGPGEESAPQD